MENRTYGDKASFAVECAEEMPHGGGRYGACALWLGGQRLQEVDAPVNLGSVLRSLQGIVAAESLNFAPDTPITAKALLQMMEGQGLPNAERHYFLAIEGFDDFLKLYFKGESSTIFLWSIHPQVASVKEYADYSSGVVRVEVSNDAIRKSVREFAASLGVGT